MTCRMLFRDKEYKYLEIEVTTAYLDTYAFIEHRTLSLYELLINHVIK